MTKPRFVGAVAYTPDVVTMGEGSRDYSAGTETEMDFVLFSNYGRQVEELIAGDIDVAWNTDLAWARASHEFVGLRDGALVLRRGPAIDHLAALDPAVVPVRLMRSASRRLPQGEVRGA